MCLPGIAMNWGFPVAWLSIRPGLLAEDLGVIGMMLAGAIWYVEH